MKYNSHNRSPWWRYLLDYIFFVHLKIISMNKECYPVGQGWLICPGHVSSLTHWLPGGFDYSLKLINFKLISTINMYFLSPREPHALVWGPSCSHTKIFRIERTRLKTGEKLPTPCKFCTHRFIRYSSTCYGKVRIDPLMANIRNPDFFCLPGSECHMACCGSAMLPE